MIELKRYSWEYEIDSRYYRPIEDTITVLTWRKEPMPEVKRSWHKYPLRGCHGGPLQHPDAEDRTDIP